MNIRFKLTYRNWCPSYCCSACPGSDFGAEQAYSHLLNHLRQGHKVSPNEHARISEHAATAEIERLSRDTINRNL